MYIKLNIFFEVGIGVDKCLHEHISVEVKTLTFGKCVPDAVADVKIKKINIIFSFLLIWLCFIYFLENPIFFLNTFKISDYIRLLINKDILNTFNRFLLKLLSSCLLIDWYKFWVMLFLFKDSYFFSKLSLILLIFII